MGKKIISGRTGASWFFMFLGILFAGIGGFLFYQSMMTKYTGFPVQAEIIEVQEHYDSDDNSTTYSPVYQFTYEGNEMVRESSMSSSSHITVGIMKEIYYSPVTDDIVSNGVDLYFGLFFLIPGLLVIFFGIKILVGERRRKQIKEKLLTSQYKVTLPIAEVCRGWVVNNQPTFFVKCYFQGKDGERIEMKSESYFGRLEDMQVGGKVDIFLSPENAREYWIDLESYSPLNDGKIVDNTTAPYEMESPMRDEFGMPKKI